MSLRLFGALVLSFAMVSVGGAQEKGKTDKKGKMEGKPAAGPPTPSPEFTNATKYFYGTWKCEGTAPAGPMGPGGKSTSNLTFKSALGGFYMFVDGDNKTGTMAMSFHGINGYDMVGKKFMRADFDSMGGAGHMTSPGWVGDKLVFDGDMMMGPNKMKVRHTMTKKSDKEFTSSFEMIHPDGKSMPMGDEVCKKTM